MLRNLSLLLLIVFSACVPREKASPLPAEDSCTTATKEEAQKADIDVLLPRYSTSLKRCMEARSLSLAARAGDADWVAYEIERGADVNKGDPITSSTPLMVAAFEKSTEVVKLLLEAGADPNIPRNDDGKTAVSDGFTPLIIAADRGNYEIAKLLLEHGADPNKSSSDNGLTGASDGSPPLMLAVDRGNYKIAKLLLEHGADPDKPGSNNGLTGASEGSNPLVTASEDGNTEIVKLLLEHGADPNKARSDNGKVPQADGSTPLFAAVGKGRTKVVGLLLEAGANPDKGRSANGKSYAADGATPLMFAVGKKPNVEIAKMLLDAGARLDVTSPNGGTALDYAKRYGTAETVKLLEGYMSKEEQTKGKLRDVLEVL